jgi:ribosomal protein L40E
MTCRTCGHENPTGAQFCNGCATALSARCAACGASNPAGARFCNQCAGPLSSLRQTTDSLTTNNFPPNHRSYTPKHLADKILNPRAALEGERKQVTVLFAGVLHTCANYLQVGHEFS